MLTRMDGYIFKQLLDFFIISLVVFTLLLFFSDAFFDFAKDSQRYGLTGDVMLALIGLQLPAILANILPLSTLLAILLVYSNLNNQMELIAFRMSGVSVYRLAVPAVILAFFSVSLTYGLHDFVRPLANKYALGLKRMSLYEFSLPGHHENFVFKQYDDQQRLQRLFYIAEYRDRQLGYATVIDLTNPKTMQVTQAQSGVWEGANIMLNHASVHTVASTGKLTNTTQADQLKLAHFVRPKVEFTLYKPKEMSFFQLRDWIEQLKQQGKPVDKDLLVLWWEKIAVPLSGFPLALLAVPLAISPPRQVKNVGFLSAITLFFLYYLLRYVSTEFGKMTGLPAGMVAFFPMALLLVTATVLFIRKNNRL